MHEEYRGSGTMNHCRQVPAIKFTNVWSLVVNASSLLFNFLQNVRGKWVCTLCMKRREHACASGKWFHGRRAQPTVDSGTFQRKLSDVWDGIESDWVSVALNYHQIKKIRSFQFKNRSALSLVTIYNKAIRGRSFQKKG